MNWNEAITEGTPERVVKAIKRVYGSYPAECLPAGICDPMYIMNVICLELGVGDGQGHFDLEAKPGYHELLKAARLALPWLGKMIADGGHLSSVAPSHAVKAMEELQAAIFAAEGREAPDAR